MPGAAIRIPFTQVNSSAGRSWINQGRMHKPLFLANEKGIFYLDLYTAAIRHIQIDGSNWSGNEEGDLVELSADRQLIGADLIGSVAIGRNTVSTHDDGVGLGRGIHQGSNHTVGDLERRGVVSSKRHWKKESYTHQCAWNLLRHQFVGSEPRTLIVRPCLCAEGPLEPSALVEGTDNTQSRAIACVCRRKCIELALLSAPC